MILFIDISRVGGQILIKLVSLGRGDLTYLEGKNEEQSLIREMCVGGVTLEKKMGSWKKERGKKLRNIANENDKGNEMPQ